jgi:hypothetical protein
VAAERLQEERSMLFASIAREEDDAVEGEA